MLEKVQTQEGKTIDYREAGTQGRQDTGWGQLCLPCPSPFIFLHHTHRLLIQYTIGDSDFFLLFASL